MYNFQKISNYGTSTPAVARTLPQGSELLGFFFKATSEQKDACKEVLMQLKRHLVRCVEIKDRIASEIQTSRKSIEDNGFDFQARGRAVSLPGVPDLHSNAEAFLQSAKLAIRETAHLVEPFYGEKHDHRFQLFAAWAEMQFGADDDFTKAIRNWEPWVKDIVTRRNAVDHPHDKPGGKLVTYNFDLAGTPEAPILVEPKWGLSGDSESFMQPDMEDIIESIIQIGEEILVGLFYKFKSDIPLVVNEIPQEERDPAFPVRLRVAMPPRGTSEGK